VVFLWLASDWPIGSLGAGYLSSVHMLQYMIYTLGAAPLLILGTPSWMLERIMEVTRSRAAVRALSRPLVAAVLFNVVLIATHAPVTVDTLRSTQVGNFALDMVWLASGFLLWMPVISPIDEFRARSAPARIVYLFCAAALIPMIPGGFIAFSPQPLYGTYELAPRVGPSALDDQQMAGVLMKIGNLPVIWAVMAVIWFRWFEREQRASRERRVARGRSRVAAVAGGVPPVPDDR
jgi:cytochrome c oxidase assembly factor CtaG